MILNAKKNRFILFKIQKNGYELSKSWQNYIKNKIN